MIQRIIKSIFVLIAFSFICTAQQTNEYSLFNLAQQYKEERQWEQAVPLYEQLYALNPNNFLYFNGLLQCYCQLKQYEKAIALSREWLKTHPKEIPVKISLAGIYYDSGNEGKADSLWNAILSEASSNTTVYKLVAQEMLQHRLYDKAIQTYLKARTVSNNPALFADDVGILYLSLQQYEEGAQEYIQMLEQTPQNLSFVQSRLRSAVLRPEALQKITQVTQKSIRKSPQNSSLYQLLLWLQLESNQPFEAIETAKTLDKVSRANGAELLRFAQRLAEEQYTEASAFAYHEYLVLYPAQPSTSVAQFGLANALYKLSKIKEPLFYDEENEQHATVSRELPFPISYSEALKMYHSSLRNATSDIAAQAWYNIGEIYFEQFNNVDSALFALNNVIQLQQGTELYFQAVQKIGEVYLAKENFQEAQRYFWLLTRSNIVNYQHYGFYWLARTQYYTAHFDSALSFLDLLTKNLSAPIANDALELKIFIRENNSSSLDALEKFAQADFLVHQQKYDKAINLFNTIRRTYPQALLIDETLLKLGELYARSGRTEDAISTFQFLADSLPYSIWKDRALWNIGFLYDHVLHNATLAVQTYESLIAQYPNSLYAEKCRKRIRTLRGDTRQIQ